jgi:hypothetical protein
MLLFDGYRKTYGMYSGNLVGDDSGKLKGAATTVKGDVTVELWMQHLAGRRGLGIIPIDESSRVRFAAIDIDQYPLDLMLLNANIQKLKLPLVLCRTKSGGAHLYCFIETFSDAGHVQRKMRDFASLLGYGNSEIFPKQTTIVAERGDVGSWINMPYYQSHDTTRYALDDTGKALTFIEFMKYARSKIVSFDMLMAYKAVDVENLPGGPPCLNHLTGMGFPEGTRNAGLFNIAVYCKKAYGDNWQQYVYKYNMDFMRPPLVEDEVRAVIKSIGKKDFNYTCKQAPICNYCNMPKCRATKFGIGAGDLGMPKFGSLTKVCTDPPMWFLDVDGGGRLELTTEDLQNPRNFQTRCMAVLNIMPIPPKMAEWQEIVHKLLSEVTEIPVPEEATPKGQLWQHLEDFLTGRVQCKIIDELLLGKPWFHNGFYYFRMQDFLAYLDRKKWHAMPPHNIPVHFQEWKFGKKFWNIRGKGTNTYYVDGREFETQESAVPTLEIVSPEGVLS